MINLRLDKLQRYQKMVRQGNNGIILLKKLQRYQKMVRKGNNDNLLLNDYSRETASPCLQGIFLNIPQK